MATVTIAIIISVVAIVIIVEEFVGTETVVKEVDGFCLFAAISIDTKLQKFVYRHDK